MKDNTKILIGFLTIIILILTQVIVTFRIQSDILEDMKQLKNVEAPLETMSEQVIGYDAILTGNVHAALLHALNGQYSEIKAHKERYDEIGTKLDNLLKRDARILLSQSKRPQEVKDKIDEDLKNLDRLNLLLVDLEIRAFDAMENKDPETAYSLVVGGNYDIYKKELYDTYRDWADIEHETALNDQKDIIKESQHIIYLNLIISVLILIIIIIVILIIRSFVAEELHRNVKKR